MARSLTVALLSAVLVVGCANDDPSLPDATDTQPRDYWLFIPASIALYLLSVN